MSTIYERLVELKLKALKGKVDCPEEGICVNADCFAFSKKMQSIALISQAESGFQFCILNLNLMMLMTVLAILNPNLISPPNTVETA